MEKFYNKSMMIPNSPTILILVSNTDTLIFASKSFLSATIHLCIIYLNYLVKNIIGLFELE
jgi:hypothetical protein